MAGVASNGNRRRRIDRKYVRPYSSSLGVAGNVSSPLSLSRPSLSSSSRLASSYSSYSPNRHPHTRLPPPPFPLPPLLLVPPTNKRLRSTTPYRSNTSTVHIFKHPRQRQLSHLASHAVPKLVGIEAETDKADTTAETNEIMDPRPYPSQA
ncbi:hypothetical protein GYMLUDRAFT_253391 [Collybiopsis luxurians FD-317 M1]|uniref:Uncharacterized protein n=1 Tax=Collybiopsis luxurians FD-317 M1 TaxID=944289 RepID=A0A0D0C5H0_9AGAR|nr:hypothetical protein GYMLUDRAFT_253391 [Collybiopsis luxurians FD-317 M1]